MMKSKYEKIIFEANALASRIPALNHWGASLDVSDYVSGYVDFEKGLKCLTTIIYNIEQLSGWEESKRKMKNDKENYYFDSDYEDIVLSIEHHLEIVNNELNNLKEFVEQREKEHWR